METRRTHYVRKWKKEGKCINCGSPRDPQTPGQLCPNCRRLTLAYKRRVREKVKAEGRCYHCHIQLPDGWGKTKCQNCYERNKKSIATVKAEWRENGKCSGCGRDPVAGKKMCADCIKQMVLRQRAKANRFLDAGLCRDCGKDPFRPGMRTCQVCSDSYRINRIRARNQRISDGVCVTCGKNPAATGMTYCRECRNVINAKRQLLRDRVFAAYGGPVCVCCGETFREFLHIDHINNDGAQHRKSCKGAGSIYTWLRHHKFPPGFQVLCANCNLAKAKYGICPHQRKKNSDGDATT